jgi:hypothetical protein
LDYQIEKSEMGKACIKYGRYERCIQGFGGETSGKETTWKTQAQKGRKYYNGSSTRGVMDWIDNGSGQGQVAGSCECGNEPSGSIKCREFLN